MASQLDICNLALLRLGQGKIAAMDEASNEARYCSQFWEADRRAALRDYPWNFALSDPTVLTLLEDDAPLDFGYAYQLPTDCVRPLELYDATHLGEYPAGDINLIESANLTQTEQMFFQVRQGRVLVTNLANAALKYIVNITDTTKFDDSFVQALSYRLAIDLALPITGNAQFAQTMAALYRAELLSARTNDAREGRNRLKVGKSFLQSRR